MVDGFTHSSCLSDSHVSLGQLHEHRILLLESSKHHRSLGRVPSLSPGFADQVIDTPTNASHGYVENHLFVKESSFPRDHAIHFHVSERESISFLWQNIFYQDHRHPVVGSARYIAFLSWFLDSQSRAAPGKKKGT